MRQSFLALLAVLVLYPVFGGCKEHKEKTPGKGPKRPKGYQLDKPDIVSLPAELSDISGLAYDAKDSSVFAISDDYGFLYKIPLANPGKITKWPFHKSKDFEDIVLLDNKFYVLNSNGNIVVFSNDPKAADVKEYKFPYPGKNEFEILYYDNQIRKLVIICKGCADDNKKLVSAYVFDPATCKYDLASFDLNAKKIASKADEGKSRFKASAAAINPLNGQVYIVSSINKLLVVTDHDGKTRKAYELDPQLFKQPEGLTFTPHGTMLISNESAKKGQANILIFRHTPK